MSINPITFNGDNMTLVPPNKSYPYIHSEWLISMENSSAIIFDIENFDANTPAELLIHNGNISLKDDQNKI